jgi:hypothetical protein
MQTEIPHVLGIAMDHMPNILGGLGACFHAQGGLIPLRGHRRTVTGLAFFRHQIRILSPGCTGPYARPQGSTLSSLSNQSVIESTVSWALISVTDSPFLAYNIVVNGYRATGLTAPLSPSRAKNGTFILKSFLSPSHSLRPLRLLPFLSQ